MTPTQDLLAANQAFYRAFEKMDLEAMSLVWSKGTSCVCIHPGRMAIRGWEQIRHSWEQIFKTTSRLEVKTEILTAEVNDTFAYVVLVEKLVQVVSDRPIEAQGIATNIFERMGSSWYLIHHHGSPVMRPMAPPGQPRPN